MNTKTVFQYDAAGFYIGTAEADESPLEPGVWHMPKRTTDQAPPDMPAGRTARWNGVQWAVSNRPAAANDTNEATAKLAAFLAANPDVARLVNVA